MEHAVWGADGDGEDGDALGGECSCRTQRVAAVGVGSVREQQDGGGSRWPGGSDVVEGALERVAWLPRTAVTVRASERTLRRTGGTSAMPLASPFRKWSKNRCWNATASAP
jgi:hypothetical protein